MTMKVNDGKQLRIMLQDEKVRNMLQKIFDCIHDRIYLVDDKGEILLINKAVEYDNDGRILIGQNVETLAKEGFCKESLVAKVIKSRHPQGYIHCEDQGYDLLAWAMPCMDEDKVSFVVCTEWDVDRLYTIEKHLRNILHLEDRNRIEIFGNTGTNFFPENIVAESQNMKEVLDIASVAARTDTTTLLLGESGTGKEVVMRYIHYKSNRVDSPLVEINCGAIPENLIESELFGYVNGAFTGASSGGQIGIFELGNHGTVFLDEIDALPLQAQVKLLRVLQEKEVVRLGGHMKIPLDVKIIAASNTDLKKMVAERKFREDLYYRLNILPIHIPPLRERKADIPALLDFFSQLFNTKYGKHIEINPQDLDLFLEYDWPGNIRELKNVIERTFLIARQGVIERSVWIKELGRMDVDAIRYFEKEHTRKRLNLNLKQELELFERELYKKYAPDFESSKQLADFFGVEKSTVNRKLKKYGICIQQKFTEKSSETTTI